MGERYVSTAQEAVCRNTTNRRQPQRGAVETTQQPGKALRLVDTGEAPALQADQANQIAVVGVAEIEAGSRRRTVLNDADTRLYRAKREGRNRVIGS